MLILVSFGWLLLRLLRPLLLVVEVVVTDDVGLASTGPTPLPLLVLSLDVDEAAAEAAEAAVIEADCSTDGGDLKSIRLRG